MGFALPSCLALNCSVPASRQLRSDASLAPSAQRGHIVSATRTMRSDIVFKPILRMILKSIVVPFSLLMLATATNAADVTIKLLHVEQNPQVSGFWKDIAR